MLWIPRALSILYVVFISLFALDTFNEEHTFWKLVLALLIHLIPSAVLLAAVILAWKWEWIGAAVYGVAGILYVSWVLRLRIPSATKQMWIFLIAGPALCVAALYLLNWIRHNELHPHRM